MPLSSYCRLGLQQNTELCIAYQVFNGCRSSSQPCLCNPFLGQSVWLACTHLLYHGLHDGAHHNLNALNQTTAQAHLLYLYDTFVIKSAAMMLEL